MPTLRSILNAKVRHSDFTEKLTLVGVTNSLEIHLTNERPLSKYDRIWQVYDPVAADPAGLLYDETKAAERGSNLTPRAGRGKSPLHMSIHDIRLYLSYIPY